jgi:hypothetical protein
MRKIFGLALLLILAASAVADHLPEKSLARGKPETTLAGINLESTTLDEVLRKYGPPTRTITVPNNPQWTGYLWQTVETRLELDVTAGAGGKHYLGGISVVRIGGGSAPAKASSDATGSGLKLGDGLDALKRIYGSRFQLSRQPDIPAATSKPFLAVPGSQTATVQWTPAEFTLTVGLNSGGRIVALRLQPPECYPGGCQ